MKAQEQSAYFKYSDPLIFLGQSAEVSGMSELSVIDAAEFIVDREGQGYGPANQGHTSQFFKTFSDRSRYWSNLLEEFFPTVNGSN